jgi:hypothetical protein
MTSPSFDAFGGRQHLRRLKEEFQIQGLLPRIPLKQSPDVLSWIGRAEEMGCTFCWLCTTVTALWLDCFVTMTIEKRRRT